MPGFEISEKLPCRANLTVVDIFESLTYTLVRAGARSNIEQTLIRFCILDDGRGFTFDRENHWALGLLELFHEVAGPAAEGG
jgi:hypothetical protein